MDLSQRFNGFSFPAVFAKFLLNQEKIDNIHNRFVNRFKSNDSNWVEKAGEYEKEDKKSKVHSEFIESIKNQVFRVLWKNSNVYFSGNNLFFIEQNNNSLVALVFNCPPYVNPPDVLEDTWVRKVVPFTFGNIKTTLNVGDEINFSEIEKERNFFFPIIRDPRIINVKMIFSQYEWELKTKKAKEEE